jgi:hypothetical protein
MEEEAQGFAANLLAGEGGAAGNTMDGGGNNCTHWVAVIGGNVGQYSELINMLA